MLLSNPFIPYNNIRNKKRILTLDPPVSSSRRVGRREEVCMKTALGVCLTLSLLVPTLSFGQLAFDPSNPTRLFTRSWAQKAVRPLGHGLTAEERDYIQNNMNEYLASKYGDATPRVRDNKTRIAPAEFEKADGCCFAWQGYSGLMTQLVSFVTETDKAFVIVDRESDIASTKRRLVDAGANEENLEFVVKYLNSVWMRDYGPWWTYTSDGEREIIDLDYNRPRPQDDEFPSALARKYGIPAHVLDLILPGGNLILDGHGVAIMTDVTFDPSQGGDPNLTIPQLEAFMKDYFGCKKVIILRDMNQDGTGHVDMYCKLLNDTTFIVGRYANPSDGAPGNAEILDEAAARLESETNGKGEPFKVFRIPMPPRHWGTTYSYTNSLICNQKVLVPVYGHETEEEALNIYRKLLPGYDVKGFDSNNIISANGAIHCITKLFMADPIELNHETPEVRAGANTFEVNVDASELPQKVELHWAPEGSDEFFTVDCVNGEKPGHYSVDVDLEAGTKVNYWFSADLDRGITGSFPKGAESAPISVTVGQ